MLANKAKIQLYNPQLGKTELKHSHQCSQFTKEVERTEIKVGGWNHSQLELDSMHLRAEAQI